MGRQAWDLLDELIAAILDTGMTFDVPPWLSPVNTSKVPDKVVLQFAIGPASDPSIYLHGSMFGSADARE